MEGLDPQQGVALFGVLLFLALFIFDLTFQGKFSTKKLIVLSFFYVLCGVFFGLLIWYVMGLNAAGDYFTAFFVEKSLSVDNIFIIALIFKDFAIPFHMQRRILFWGILSAGVFRFIMMAGGVAILNLFSWLLILAGLLLLFLGMKGVWKFTKGKSGNYFVPSLSWFPKSLSKFVDRNALGFCTITDGRIVFQRLFLALFCVEMVDLLFALDSVPAALAVTQDLFLVYSSNMFALLGLRSMFLVFGDKIHLLNRLGFFISLILIFIGGKIILTSLFDFHVPSYVSLIITFSLLLFGILYSFLRSKK